jgi:hypothetical protein
VGSQVGLTAGQPDQQLLDTSVDGGGQVLAAEAARAPSIFQATPPTTASRMVGG